MEILSKLFGSATRVKIMKLFLANSEQVFDSADIYKRAKVTSTSGRKEINLLYKTGLIMKKVFFKEVKKKKRGKIVLEKKKTNGWIINEKFPMMIPLQNLLIKTKPLADNEITKQLTTLTKSQKLSLFRTGRKLLSVKLKGTAVLNSYGSPFQDGSGSIGI